MPQTKPKTITIRLGGQERERIESYAAAREMTVSEFVRYAVRVYTDSTPEQER